MECIKGWRAMLTRWIPESHLARTKGKLRLAWLLSSVIVIALAVLIISGVSDRILGHRASNVLLLIALLIGLFWSAVNALRRWRQHGITTAIVLEYGIGIGVGILLAVLVLKVRLIG